MKHPLASLDGLGLTLAILLAMGAACPVCGFGTRATSKGWARCERCGERVERRSAEDVGNEIRSRIGSAVTPDTSQPEAV